MTDQDTLTDLQNWLATDATALPKHVVDLRDAELAELMNRLSVADAAEVLRRIPVRAAVRLCDHPSLRRRAALLDQLEPDQAARILEGLSADERTQVVRKMSPRERHRLMPEVAPAVRGEIEALLQYPPRTAGGIMTTEFVHLDPDCVVRDALASIRTFAQEKESIYACYVLEPGSDRLLGAVSLRDLVTADPSARVADVMRRNPVSVRADDPQHVAAEKISKYNLLAVPVLDAHRKVLGFVTVDDVIDVLVQEETERTLKMGAVEPGALELPYMTMAFRDMVKKRATWLVILFLSEMLTATAMGYFEGEIAKAVVLALFVPLIISSGGNSGSQASTLVIRAMALGELGLADWWRVARREIFSGLALGCILGTIGFLRIALWTMFTPIYGPHWVLVGLTVGCSLVGVVMWGTLSGAMLPILLRRLGADPATSSAPFVATLVDVTGLIIYFTVAAVIMRGTVL